LPWYPRIRFSLALSPSRPKISMFQPGWPEWTVVYFGQFFKKITDYFPPMFEFCIYFEQKNGLGHILGDFFTS
jgi:hypothetical protein